MASPRRKPTHNGGRPRIDWTDALAFYIAEGSTRTYAKVAAEYGVTEGAVRKHAKADDWPGKVAAIDRRTAEKAMAGAEWTLEQARTQILRVGHKILDELELDQRDIPKPSDYQGVSKTILLAFGEATDVIGIAEAQDLQRVLLAMVKEAMTPDQYAAFLDAFQQRAAG
jgi:predicted transcriptional regulator